MTKVELSEVLQDHLNGGGNDRDGNWYCGCGEYMSNQPQTTSDHLADVVLAWLASEGWRPPEAARTGPESDERPESVSVEAQR